MAEITFNAVRIARLSRIPSPSESFGSITAGTGMAIDNDSLLARIQSDNVNDPTVSLVDSYSETNRNTFTALVSGSFEAVGQNFIGNGENLDSCKFYLTKTGSPTGSAYAKLYAHTGTFGVDGKPTGSALATSIAFDVATLTFSWQLITFNFTGANRYSMVNGTKYFIIIEYTSGNSFNYVVVGDDGSSPSHAGNEAAYFSGWVGDNTWDTCFYVYSRNDATNADTFDRLDRLGLVFDTSPLSANTIVTGVVLSVYGDGVKQNTLGGSPSMQVTDFNPASSANLVKADFTRGSFGAVNWKGISYASLATAGWNDFDLLNEALPNINLAGDSSFGLRWNWDVEDFFGGTAGSGKVLAVQFQNVGDSNPPKLTITYYPIIPKPLGFLSGKRKSGGFLTGLKQESKSDMIRKEGGFLTGSKKAQ